MGVVLTTPQNNSQRKAKVPKCKLIFDGKKIKSKDFIVIE
jgi:hypothetical protein